MGVCVCAYETCVGMFYMIILLSFCLIYTHNHNHLGYAGRTELPDNLKSMFRPISMIVPDSGLIAEIILFGEGFSQTRVSKQDNLVTFYLCSCLI